MMNRRYYAWFINRGTTKRCVGTITFSYRDHAKRLIGIWKSMSVVEKVGITEVVD
jgi:hypothetical protein